MKLYRFRYSPYARKVQMVLDLAGATYQTIEVPYVERQELAALTGGYVLVPVLVNDDAKVIFDSREICSFLLQGSVSALLAPPPFEGPIWAYADFVDGPLEDVLFRLASPYVRDAWPTAWERGLYVFTKERKFGAGCVDTWDRERDALLAKARKLLAPTLSTLDRQPFLFGNAPTLADAALYGVGVMLEEASKELPATLDSRLPGFLRRLEAARPSRR